MEQDRSLRNNIDATNKVNDIRLSLNSDTGGKIVWILVEGEHNCKINFSGLNYGEKLSEIVDGKIRIKQNELLTALNTRSSNKTEIVTIENINQFIENHKTMDMFHLCQGHDTTALLALIVRGQVSHKEFCGIYDCLLC